MNNKAIEHIQKRRARYEDKLIASNRCFGEPGKFYELIHDCDRELQALHMEDAEINFKLSPHKHAQPSIFFHPTPAAHSGEIYGFWWNLFHW